MSRLSSCAALLLILSTVSVADEPKKVCVLFWYEKANPTNVRHATYKGDAAMDNMVAKAEQANPGWAYYWRRIEASRLDNRIAFELSRDKEVPALVPDLTKSKWIGDPYHFFGFYFGSGNRFVEVIALSGQKPSLREGVYEQTGHRIRYKINPGQEHHSDDDNCGPWHPLSIKTDAKRGKNVIVDDLAVEYVILDETEGAHLTAPASTR